jgi:AmmeMemoRadiSam system protein A
MAPGRLSDTDRAELLGVARASIHERLRHSVLSVRHEEFAEPLRELRATFVTLHVNRELRGCIGTLEARRALVADVAHNAGAAAFEDPRFPALAWHEYERLTIHISILSPAEPLRFSSEQELVEQLRPNVDGLILEADARRGTFLPAVWESLPDPRDFLRHLKRKAGLAPDYWSDDLRVKRYTVESIS